MSTLSNFARMLRRHDWYYNYSDDHRAWTKGRNQWMAITAAKKRINEMGEDKAKLGDALFVKYQPKEL